jgi:hypothetical protein
MLLDTTVGHEGATYGTIFGAVWRAQGYDPDRAERRRNPPLGSVRVAGARSNDTTPYHVLLEHPSASSLPMLDLCCEKHGRRPPLGRRELLALVEEARRRRFEGDAPIIRR